MRDVSLNPIRPAATELTWLDDPAIAATLVTLAAGALRVVIAPEVGGALAAFYEIDARRPAALAAAGHASGVR